MGKRKKARKKMSMRRRMQTHKSGFSSTALDVPENTKFFKLKSEGVRRIDVIPFIARASNPYADAVGEAYPERTFWAHRYIGANRRDYVCPAKTVNKPCPICDAIAEERNRKHPDEKLIKDLAPKERQLWNVIDLEDRDKGIQLWEVSHHLFGRALDSKLEHADEEDEYESFFDTEEGMYLKLGVEEKTIGSGKPFFSVEDIEFKVRKKQYDDSIIEDALNLDDILVIKSYKELEAVLNQEEVEEEEEAKPAKKAPTRKKKAKKPEPEPEEEEDDWEDEDSEPEEEEDDWEDEEEDSEPEEEEDDWEDEEEEAKPAKKAPKKAKPAKKAPPKKKKAKKPEPEPEEEEEEEDEWDDEWDDD